MATLCNDTPAGKSTANLGASCAESTALNLHHNPLLDRDFVSEDYDSEEDKD
jgi:hypothetical protein